MKILTTNLDGKQKWMEVTDLIEKIKAEKSGTKKGKGGKKGGK